MDATHGGLVRGIDVDTNGRHTFENVQTLAPVVDGDHRTDDIDHRIGKIAVVVGNIGEILDLANDVVADVANETTLQWRKIGKHWRLVDAQQRLHRGENAAVGRHASGK